MKSVRDQFMLEMVTPVPGIVPLKPFGAVNGFPL
jgi:hypothetical protein